MIYVCADEDVWFHFTCDGGGSESADFFVSGDGVEDADIFEWFFGKDAS